MRPVWKAEFHSVTGSGLGLAPNWLHMKAATLLGAERALRPLRSSGARYGFLPMMSATPTSLQPSITTPFFRNMSCVSLVRWLS